MIRKIAAMTPEEYAEHAAETLRRNKRPKSPETIQKIRESNKAFWALARKTLAEQEFHQRELPFQDT